MDYPGVLQTQPLSTYISQIRHGDLTFSISAVQYHITRCLRQNVVFNFHTHRQIYYTVIYIL